MLHFEIPARAAGQIAKSVVLDEVRKYEGKTPT
jgi:hypothetical protein